jgi:hypothetical protein
MTHISSSFPELIPETTGISALSLSASKRKKNIMLRSWAENAFKANKDRIKKVETSDQISTPLSQISFFLFGYMLY